MQNFEIKNSKIREAFKKWKRENPRDINNRLKLSWSNWGFGVESLSESAARLEKAGIKYIELHGNHYSSDLGYKAGETLKILADHGVKTAGICGMFSVDNDLSSNRAVHRQSAIDYIKRELDFASEVGAGYMLIVPGACGRPDKYDDTELDRSVETLNKVADLFVEHGVKAAIEPIRSAEVSFIHTIAEAKFFIEAVNHPGVQYINGDLYHMQVEEPHIGEAILDAGEKLVNLHMADSNRCALGEGSLDLDTVIMSLYLIGYHNADRFATPEPLGPGGAPYPAMYGKPNKTALDKLVMQTAYYFREREEAVLAL